MQGSGFDRGHLAPAGNHKQSQEHCDETFFLSNIAPQVGAGFNRDKWEHLERYVRKLTKRYKNVYVCTGPLYLPKRESDGKNYVKYFCLIRTRIRRWLTVASFQVSGHWHQQCLRSNPFLQNCGRRARQQRPRNGSLRLAQRGDTRQRPIGFFYGKPPLPYFIWWEIFEISEVFLGATRRHWACRRSPIFWQDK